MRVLIAGAGGTLGLPLVRKLVAGGHEVVGLTRSSGKRALIEEAGARAVIADALDREALTTAVSEATPSHVVNLLTALPAAGARRPEELRPTNRLRTEGSNNLLSASIDAGAQRLVAESFLGVLGRPSRDELFSEEAPYGPIDASDPLFETVQALRELERQHEVARRQGHIEAVVLRFGFFYGSGVSSTETLIEALKRGRLRLPGRMPWRVSWIHIEDAAAAVVAALEHPSPAGLYHVADDQPMSLADAARVASAAFGVRPPGRLPLFVLRWFAPVFAAMTTANLALDNARLKRELGWTPAFPTLREGFDEMAQRRRIRSA